MSYSALIYTRKVGQQSYNTIISYIQKGTKVYFLATSRQKEIEGYINKLKDGKRIPDV